MQTLVPPAITAQARPLGKTGRIFGFALTTRSLLLVAVGLLWAIPAFFHHQRIWMMAAWDAFILLLLLVDSIAPAPERIRVTRTFLGSPRLGERTEVELSVVHDTNGILDIDLTDDLEPTLMPTPLTRRLRAFPRDPVKTILACYPSRRGELRLGNIYIQYRSSFGLIARWAVCETAQTIRVYPAMQEDGSNADLYLMRARQLELQKRRLRQRGIGREFESLRDYQRGDELRNISWPATARRARLITRQFTTERSQQVWIVLDAGRLSRTAFILRRQAGTFTQHDDAIAREPDALNLHVTQLDQATTASVMLAEAVTGSGDKFGLLTYGRSVQQQLLPGSGPSHLRMLIDQLSQVRSEPSEANHLQAAARLKQLQRRRGLVVWITEIADSAGRPEVVSAAVDLVRRHLVLLVILQHPELDALAARKSGNVDEMFASAAAKEMLDRRRETVARLRQRGVLVVECTPADVGLRTINSYLEVKAKGLL